MPPKVIRQTKIGRRLRRARLMAVVPATVLAEAVGASRDLVRQIEEGLVESPGVVVISRLAEALDVPLVWLVQGRGEAPDAARLAAAGARLVTSTRLRTGNGA